MSSGRRVTRAPTARHLLALSLGVVPGVGSRCAICELSEFDTAGPWRRVLGANFVDFDEFADDGAPDICLGCARLMAGRPGDDPPPLRTVSVMVGTDADLTVLDQRDWWALVTGDTLVPDGGVVLSWATSRKRHHWLRAGISTPECWVVGSDAGPIEWRPDAAVAAAVVSMRQIGATKGAILSGHYPPRLVAEHLDTVQCAESTIAPLRGHAILDLIVWAAPTIERSDWSPKEETQMIDKNDARAAELVGRLVWGSEMRANDGKVFWGGYLLRRLRRFARLPLATCVSRLAGECRVSAQAAGEVVGMLDAMTTDEQSAVESSLRERTDLIHALAFARMAEYRKSRPTTSTENSVS